MSFIARLQRAREILEQQGRLSTRALERELEIGGDELDELIEELVDVQQVARREGKILVWAGPSAAKPPAAARERAAHGTSPTPRADADRADARKVVTLIFADLIGSTSLHERLDPESVTRFMESYYGAMRSAVDAHSGTVVKLLGDGVMVAFGVPRVAEDDAIRAVRAGIAMQHAFRELARNEATTVGDIGLRVGINTGEVIVSADNTDVVGDPVNVAARLQQEAHDGEVVIGESTRRLVAALVTLAPLGSFALKGRWEAMKAYRVVSLEPPAGAIAAAFVGRDAEIARLTAVYDAAANTPAARVAVLLGSPGLGKSRLIEEFIRRQGESVSVLTAHCDAAGGATFAPLAAALRELLSAHRDQVPLLAKEGSGEVGQLAKQPPPSPLLGKEGEESTSLRAALEAAVPAADADRTRIVAGITALLAGSPASPEETFFVIRRFLAALTLVKPVVLVIDDLQWAEPLLLDLVEHLVQWGNGLPLLVLVGARPELRDLRSSLVTPGGLVADVLTLSGLDAGAAMRLAANVIGAEDLPAAVAAKVLATSEGNPLFVGELVRMLVQEGALTKEGDRWIPGVALATLEMPPTIHALLAARIERLRPEERSVLERAAVVGRQFSRSAVAELLPRDVVDLDARLEALRRSELIERDTGWFLGEPGLRFHHLLIRDAAYRRLLKGTRAELHARFADWVTARAGDAGDHDETIGWHLEQAHQLLRELGALDAAGRVLGERAAQHLAAAGRRALARDDLPVAADLLGRAVDRLDVDDAARADLALDWCEALLSAGDVGSAAAAIEELGRFIGDPTPSGSLPLKEGGQEGFADESSDEIPLDSPFSKGEGDRLRAWHTCFKSQLTVLTAPQGLQAAADVVAGAAEELAKLGDAAGEAKAHSVHATALARLGKVGACEAALDQALAAARRGGDRRRANAVLAGAPLAALWGPSPVTRASGRCLDVVRVLRITQGAPAVESVALSCQGVLEALRGRTEAARRMLASSRKMVEDLGIAHRLFEADAFAGRIAAMEGDTAAAERLLRGAYEGLRDLGLGIDAARAGALLARVLLVQDRIAEAESLSHESERLAGDDLQAAIAWRGVRAEALAKRGEHAEAVELARAAVAIASTTDALLDHADARMALAAALRAAGRGTEADAEERRTIELWEAKGATLLVERVRSDRERVAPIVPAAVPIATPAAVRRRVRPNAATAMQNRFDAALAARDFDAVAAQFREDHQEIDHPTGSTYGRDACIASLQRLFRSRDPRYEVEPLATVGEFLLLVRRRSSASGAASGPYDVGAYENEAIQLFEVDESGLCCRAEVFAADRLANAIARLYERYAELLPDGPERERAAATARSFGVMLTAPGDIDRMATVIAPDFESVDHRHLSTWSMRGGGVFLEHLRALREVAADVVISARDVLALGPKALLTQRLHSGTERVGGGSYERPFLVLFITQADGRLSRAEWFDTDREAEALARFEAHADMGSLPLEKGGQEGCVDESSGQIPLAPPFSKGEVVRRRVRANAATRQLERGWAAIEARDIDAVSALSSGVEVIHHPTGTTYGAAGIVAMHRGLWRGTNLKMKQDILATLGDSLALMRRTAAHDGVEAKFGSIGPVEVEHVGVFEVDERNHAMRSEIFAADHLGEAITRLYQRYAELLPDGPERARAAATTGSVRVVAPGGFDLARGFDLDGYTEVFRSDVAIVDHRVLGWGSSIGPQILFRGMAAAREVGDQLMSRPQDVLALTHDALLLRWLASGVGRESGGAFEWAFLRLFIFDPDGRVARYELFGADREAEALARFEELAGGERQPFVPSSGLRANAQSLDTAPKDGAYSGRTDMVGPRIEGFANAASRTDSELFRCFNGRDWEGVLACVAPVMVFDERRRLVRNTCDRDVWLEQFRFLFDVPNSRFTSRLRATRGERLALNFHRFEGDVAEGGGPLAMEDHFALHEVDADGRIVGLVLFDLEDEDAAHAELDARFEAGEASAYPRLTGALATNRFLQVRDWPAYAARLAPGFVYRDHRRLGWGDAGHDSESLIRIQQSAFDLSPDARYRADHIRLSARGILRQTTLLGTRDGGAFETPFFIVAEVDEQGRVASNDTYDIEDRDGALARLAELVDSEADPAPDPFENAAARAERTLMRCFNARDWAGVEACAAPDLVFDDRQPLRRLTADKQEWRTMLRFLFDVPARRFETRLLATRGERLSLHANGFEGEVADGGGPLALDDHLALYEVDGGGRIVAVVLFDTGDEVAAHAELDARFEAGVGAAVAWHPRHRRAIEARDWQAFAAATAPDFAFRDHRLLGWGTSVRDVATFVRVMQSAFDLAPDARYRDDHVRLCKRGHLAQATLLGTREGGAFEIPMLRVCEVDESGRIRGFDTYDIEHLDRARARFAVLAGPDPQPFVPSSGLPTHSPSLSPSLATAPKDGAYSGRTGIVGPRIEGFENAASRAWREVIAVWRQRDVERFAALHPTALRYRDHRRLVQLDLDRDEFLAFTRPLLEMRSNSAALDLLATRGERLALMRSTLEMADDSVGPSAIDSLLLIETDERGAIAAYDRYEIDDQDAARAEIQARWEAGEGAAHAPAAAWNAGFDAAVDRRDWETAATFFAPAFIAYDHRLVSWGTLHGPAGFLVAVQALVELAPDVRVRTQHLRTSSRALLQDKVWSGTRDGGAFENPFLGVIELDSSGWAIRVDVYDPHHLERALARSAEIGAEPNPPAPFPAREGGSQSLPSLLALARDRGRGPLAAIAKPNAATLGMDRWQATFEAALATGDWDAMRAICAPGFVFDDRRRLALIGGDREFMISSAQARVASGARPDFGFLGTAGERVAVQRVLWSGGPSNGRFEIEYLGVFEVDDVGQLTAMILFDTDDARAAQREAWTRWAAIDPVAAPWVELLTEITDAWNSHDRPRLRACYPDDFVVEDHRHAGLGRIEGAEAYLDSNVVLWELAPEQRLEIGWFWPAVDRHGFVVTIRREGTVPDGGPFESEYLLLGLARNGRFTRAAFFETDALNAALARFEDLGAKERRDPRAAIAQPNLATASMERGWAAFDVLDPDATQGVADAVRGQFTPDFVWEDRRPIVGLSGGLDLMIASARERIASGARHERRTIVGTAGDRVAIARVLWAGGPPDGRFEVEFLVVHEVNEAGLSSAIIFFDVDHEDAAKREAWARWAALDPVAAPWVELVNEFTEAWNGHDRARVRACIADDFVLEDHRHAGLGRIEGAEAYVDSIVVLWDLAPDQRLMFGWSWPVVERHGIVATMRRQGTVPDGGPFEAEHLALGLARNGRFTRVEFFEIDALDTALARFEELRPDPLRIPPNAATRARAQWARAVGARDWEAVRDLVRADFVFEDRGKRALVTGNVETWIASAEFTTTLPGIRIKTPLIGTFG